MLTLFYLSYMICSIQNPTDCHRTIPIERPFAGVAACQNAGLMMGPSWQDAHEGWKITKYDCTPNKLLQDDEAI